MERVRAPLIGHNLICSIPQQETHRLCMVSSVQQKLMK